MGDAMNRIIVEPDYLYQLFTKSPGGWTNGLRRVWDALKNWEYPLGGADPQVVIVAEVLEKCHAEAIRLLQEHCGGWWRRGVSTSGRGPSLRLSGFYLQYRRCHGLAFPLQGFPDGTLRGHPVVLPDQCALAMVLGFGLPANESGSGQSIAMIRANCIAIINSHGSGLQTKTVELLRLTQLRCHFCDSLGTVYGRGENFRAELEQQLQSEEDKIAQLCRIDLLERGDEKTLVLGLLLEAFPRLRRLASVGPSAIPVGQPCPIKAGSRSARDRRTDDAWSFPSQVVGRVQTPGPRIRSRSSGSVCQPGTVDSPTAYRDGVGRVKRTSGTDGTTGLRKAILPRRERNALKDQRHTGRQGAERSCGRAQANEQGAA